MRASPKPGIGVSPWAVAHPGNPRCFASKAYRFQDAEQEKEIFTSELLPDFDTAMPRQICRPLHLPRRPSALQRGQRLLATRTPLPPQCRPAGALLAPNDAAAPAPSWHRRALREGVVVSLLTTLLTSAVLAAPELFQQSPLTSLRQLSTPALAQGQLFRPWFLSDCP